MSVRGTPRTAAIIQSCGRTRRRRRPVAPRAEPGERRGRRLGARAPEASQAARSRAEQSAGEASPPTVPTRCLWCVSDHVRRVDGSARPPLDRRGRKSPNCHRKRLPLPRIKPDISEGATERPARMMVKTALSRVLLLAVVSTALAPGAAAITRGDFPPGFVFGAGSSAYQIEGAVTEDGRKPSIWDTFTHEGYSIDQATGDVAANQYHKYKEDVKLLHEMGVDAYRMSIAWPRLIPDGRGAVNPKGLEYYNNLIDELLSYGIQPHVTIYHFDFPQALQDEYNGLLSPKFIEDFTAYADVCFKNFGDRVKYWSTVNEPNIEPIGGYDQGILPPRRCSFPFGLGCDKGNSTTEPYIVAHHLLLAHASAVSLYREKYQAKQGGKVGLTLLGWWYEPATQTPEDVAAAARMNDFHIGWFMHPLVYGDYPPVMRKNVGSRLPSLTDEETKRILGSFDFVGFNHYIAVYVKADLSRLDEKLRDYMGDAAVKYDLPFLKSRNEFPFRLRNDFMSSTPWAMKKMLKHLKVKYKNPAVMIHENGAAGLPDPSGKNTDDDDFRSQFLQDYIEATLDSIRNGSNVQGYFVWSFLDVFEYLFGYRLRFGLYGVDFGSEERTRYQRHSAQWYAGFLRGGELRPVALPDKTYSQ